MSKLNRLRRGLMLAGAMGTMVAMATPAHAFDTLAWDWTLNLTTNVAVTGDIDIGATGGSIVEQEQTFVGGTVATATATGTPVLVFGTTPNVTADATAVNNNLNIDTNQALLLDSSQTTLGLVGVGLGVDLLNLATVDLGLLVPSLVTATSTATGLDTNVEANATAVANNLNVTSTGTALANSTQLAVAEVTATSTATGTTLLATTVADPWVSATATAVGNNLSITVAAPPAP